LLCAGCAVLLLGRLKHTKKASATVTQPGTA
jgi:hypothetical protein